MTDEKPAPAPIDLSWVTTEPDYQVTWVDHVLVALLCIGLAAVVIAGIIAVVWWLP